MATAQDMVPYLKSNLVKALRNYSSARILPFLVSAMVTIYPVPNQHWMTYLIPQDGPWFLTIVIIYFEAESSYSCSMWLYWNFKCLFLSIRVWSLGEISYYYDKMHLWISTWHEDGRDDIACWIILKF